ncbi:MAG: ABC transporter permease [bacterium]
MIGFLVKGLLRDRSRSLFPVITVVAGVTLTVFLYCWVSGSEAEYVRANAAFSTGHVKVMTRAYAREADRVPNDLALVGVGELLEQLRGEFPALAWTPRTGFGGLLDIPDSAGETRSQGAATGLALDLVSPGSPEPGILGLNSALVRGRLPAAPDEILLADDFARRLEVEPGAIATLVGSTMYGSMATWNFRVAGTVRFGIAALDRSAVVADIGAVQSALDMTDAAGGILGFFPDGIWRPAQAAAAAERFNAGVADTTDEFSPVMYTLRDQAGLARVLDLGAYVSGAVVAIFILAMSIVLWNAGLMGSLRRYGEFGVRLAVGESKGRIYRSLVAESLIVGLFGSVVGTALGVGISYYLQVRGLDIGPMLKNASLVISNVIRARVTPASFAVGFVPGIVATLLGSAISGAGIYRRQTSRLMKEMES